MTNSTNATAEGVVGDGDEPVKDGNRTATPDDGHANGDIFRENGVDENEANSKNTATDSDNGTKQQQTDDQLDQPTPKPQSVIPPSSKLQHAAVQPENIVDPTIHGDTANNVTRNTNRANYNNTVLGNDSDKNDFTSARNNLTNEQQQQQHGEAIASEDNNNNAKTLNKLKQWFATSTPDEADSYHNFSTPNSSKHEGNGGGANNKKKASDIKEGGIRKQSLDANGFDESLLNEEEKAIANDDNDDGGMGDVELGHVDNIAIAMHQNPKRRDWESPNLSRPIPGTEEEERVMGQCGFFYNEENQNGEAITSHRINAIDDTEDENLGPHPHYRARRLNPRAMAQAIKTRAKRQWTERRYRRRLRQSQFQPYPNDANNSTGHQSHRADEFTYELTTEHRQAFLAAHAALNGKLANEYGRNRHAIRKQFGYDYDIDYDLELGEEYGTEGEGQDEIRADLTRSSLAIRGGLIRLPTDNVRLVCDSHLQPGILSIETRDVGAGVMGYENYGNANRYGNIHGSGITRKNSKSDEKQQQQHHRDQTRDDSLAEEQEWRRNELAYVLTVDEGIYQRVLREMGDAYRVPCGIYYCCHVTQDGDHVGIGVAVVMLFVVFSFIVAGMIVWPSW